MHLTLSDLSHNSSVLQRVFICKPEPSQPQPRVSGSLNFTRLSSLRVQGWGQGGGAAAALPVWVICERVVLCALKMDPHVVKEEKLILQIDWQLEAVSAPHKIQ